MTLDEIKQAVMDGHTVYWANKAYKVVRDNNDHWYIVCSLNDYAIGLTHRDGVTMNGKAGQFFICDD